MFDTHSFVKDFVTAKTPEEQAEATVKILRTAFEEREEIYRRNLAAKSDLKELEFRLIKWFAAMLFAQGTFVVALITLLN